MIVSVLAVHPPLQQALSLTTFCVDTQQMDHARQMRRAMDKLATSVSEVQTTADGIMHDHLPFLNTNVYGLTEGGSSIDGVNEVQQLLHDVREEICALRTCVEQVEEAHEVLEAELQLFAESEEDAERAPDGRAADDARLARQPSDAALAGA